MTNPIQPVTQELLPCPCHLCGGQMVKDGASWAHPGGPYESCFLYYQRLDDADDIAYWNDVREPLATPPTTDTEAGLAAWARKVSVAFVGLSGGGSEMFTRIGDEFYVDPDACLARINDKLAKARTPRAPSPERNAVLEEAAMVVLSPPFSVGQHGAWSIAEAIRALKTPPTDEGQSIKSKPDMEGANCFGIPGVYRGWRITQECDDNFYGWGPNYEADYNDEDGFVGNGENVPGCPTWEALREEIDAYIEEHEGQSIQQATGSEGVAIQFTGSNCLSVIRFIGGPWTNPELQNTDRPYIGDLVAEPGDWIIRSGSGYTLARAALSALPSPPGAAALASEIERKLARLHPSNVRPDLNVTIHITRTYAEFEALLAALSGGMSRGR